MEEILNGIGTYGISFVIVAIFLWEYTTNRKKEIENQEIIKSTLQTVENSTVTISKCLTEMQQTNVNTAKSLEILQKQMETTDRKVDKILEKI